MDVAIPFFQSEFDPLQLLVKRFGGIPPSGDLGDFWWLLWLFYFDGRNRMISLSTGMNSIWLRESKMVCHIPVHSNWHEKMSFLLRNWIRKQFFENFTSMDGIV